MVCLQTQAKGLSAAVETPSLASADAAIPSTDMRIPKPGEVFYSARGVRKSTPPHALLSHTNCYAPNLQHNFNRKPTIST